MSNKKYSQEEYHNMLISECIYSKFLYSLSFRGRVSIDLGDVHYNINPYSIELDVLSNKELEDNLASIKTPWWNDFYEKRIQKNIKLLQYFKNLFLLINLLMWVPNRLYFKKKIKKESREERIYNFWKDIYKEYYNKLKAIEKGCRENTIADYSARSILVHLSTEQIKTCPPKVKELIDRCYNTLYIYCIKQKFIASEVSYEEFCKGKGIYEEDYPIGNL